ncbi:hypothetical protein EMCRGX_G014542 [Ephydatia muelleri]
MQIILETSPFGSRVVCSSSSGIRDQYRFVSIVAYFTTSDASVSPPGVPVYGQFEFECVNSAWSASSTLLDSTSKDRTMLSAGSAAINATITTNCAYCLKQIGSTPERMSDDTNHCSALCPLNCQNGGTLRSDMCGCNCTAVSTGSNCSTCLCQNGGTCNGTTCTCPPGYSGQLCNICTRTCPTGYYLNSGTCSCGQCPANCQSCSDSSTCTTCSTDYTLNSQKLCDPMCSNNCYNCTTPNSCTTCKPGYELNAASLCDLTPKPTVVANAAKGGGCDGACIGGIIGGILGAVLVAGIIAAVVAAVYFMMNSPATATSAVPGSGLSGVAKDNPLYLDPKAVEDSVAAP